MALGELSAGQCAVLNATARGDKWETVAADLGLTVNTVKTQAARAYEKLGVASRQDAVRRHARLRTSAGHICVEP